MSVIASVQPNAFYAPSLSPLNSPLFSLQEGIIFLYIRCLHSLILETQSFNTGKPSSEAPFLEVVVTKVGILKPSHRESISCESEVSKPPLSFDGNDSVHTALFSCNSSRKKQS